MNVKDRNTWTAFRDHDSELKGKYPVMGITINHKTDKDTYQDILEFPRTESGYKLISMTIRNKTLK